jgi:hypothetical protein
MVTGASNTDVGARVITFLSFSNIMRALFPDCNALNALRQEHGVVVYDTEDLTVIVHMLLTLIQGVPLMHMLLTLIQGVPLMHTLLTLIQGVFLVHMLLALIQDVPLVHILQTLIRVFILSPRRPRPASTGTSRDTCDAQESVKRNLL